MREEDYQGELPDGMIALMIPNAEIKEIVAREQVLRDEIDKIIGEIDR